MLRYPRTAQEQSIYGNNLFDDGQGDSNQQFNEEKNKLELEKMKFALEQEKAAQLKAQGLNPDGSPIAPTFNSIVGENGALSNNYALGAWQNVNPDTQALDVYKQTALRDAGSSSPWAKLMLDKQGVEQAQAADNAGAAANNTFLSAATRLAQSGGLSGGSRERMARQAGQQAFIGRQGVERQGQLDRLNIQGQDESNRMSQLSNLQGMQNTQADINFKNQSAGNEVQKYNISNLLGENNAQRAFDSNVYNQRMSAWGANKSADAQARYANSGGGKK